MEESSRMNPPENINGDMNDVNNQTRNGKYKYYVLGSVGAVIVVLISALTCVPWKCNKDTKFSSCDPPTDPENAYWTFVNNQKSNQVPTGTILEAHCSAPFVLDGPSVSVCSNGSWYPSATINCLKTCPALYSTPMVTVKCTYYGKVLKSCENAVDNTWVEYTCAPFYEDERNMKLRGICHNGMWTEEPPRCMPICGRRRSDMIIPLIINGTASIKGEFPWQVSIYYEKKFMCGGILLHERLILTVAHCIKDEERRKYEVIVGNVRSDYIEASNESYAQRSTVLHININHMYMGLPNMYAADIAIIVPEQAFNLSFYVTPICIDWLNQYREDEIPTGIVSGWGFTENAKISTELRSLEIPLVKQNVCTEVLSDYQQYIADDKICGGYINASKSPCKGDSGGGLVFNNMGKYYLFGIISLAIPDRSKVHECNSQTYTLYTKVSKYLRDFISIYYQMYKPDQPTNYKKTSDTVEVKQKEKTTNTTEVPQSTTPPVKSTKSVYTNNTNSSECILPNHPNNGFGYIYGEENHYHPGSVVPTGTFLEIKCKNQFKLDGDKLIACKDGTFTSPVGECLMVCPTLQDTSNSNVSCYYNMGKIKNCVEPINGSSALYRCASFYEYSKKMELPLYCKNGEWVPSVPQCIPRCGYKTMQDLMSNVTEVLADFPWVVAIYEDDFICTGTLLSETVAVTSADCFPKISNASYRLTAGQLYRNLSGDVQTRNITDANVHITDKLAFIILKEPLQFSRKVQPVCLDLEEKHREDHDGYMSVWGPNSGDVLRTMSVTMKHDKRVLSYKDSSESMDDGGGGIFVVHKQRYFLVGVLNVLSSEEKGLRNRAYTSYYEYTETFRTFYNKKI